MPPGRAAASSRDSAPEMSGHLVAFLQPLLGDHPGRCQQPAAWPRLQCEAVSRSDPADASIRRRHTQHRDPRSALKPWQHNGRHQPGQEPARTAAECGALDQGGLTTGVRPGGTVRVPLLKRRWELSREEALRLWSEKRLEGWQVCPPQWALPAEHQPRDGAQVTSMGRSAGPPCF